MSRMTGECANRVVRVTRELQTRVDSGNEGEAAKNFGDITIQPLLLALLRDVKGVMEKAGVPLDLVQPLLVDTREVFPDFERQLDCGSSVHDFARRKVSLKLPTSVKSAIDETIGRLHPGVVEALSLVPEPKALEMIRAPFFQKLLIGNTVQLEDHKTGWAVAGSGSIERVPVNLVELGNSKIDFENIDANILTRALVQGHNRYWKKLRDSFSSDQASALIEKATRWFLFDNLPHTFMYLRFIPAERLKTMTDDDMNTILGCKGEQEVQEWLAYQ